MNNLKVSKIPIDLEFNFRKMLNSTPSCIKVISREGLLLSMNPQGISLIEAPDLPSVMYANVYDLVVDSDREKFKNFNEMICDGATGHLVFELIGLNGTRR
jgi:hypothetical protein